MKKRSCCCRFLGVLLALMMLFGSAQAFDGNPLDYWDDSVDQAVSFGVTNAEWLEKYNALTASEENKDYAVASQSESEKDGFRVHSYEILPVLQVNLYCDPSTDEILRACVFYNWKDLSEKEMEIPDRMIEPLYSLMLRAIGYDEETSGAISEAYKNIDPNELNINTARSSRLSFAEGYTYGSLYENGTWTVALFVNRTW